MNQISHQSCEAIIIPPIFSKSFVHIITFGVSFQQIQIDLQY